MDASAAAALCDRVWDADGVPALRDYIRIPNVSPAYAPDWAEAGHMAKAVELVRAWMAARPIPGLTVEVMQLPGLTPLIFAEVPPTGGGAAGDTVLLYGHVDKQPPMTGWREGLGPWDPVVEGDRIYGRGSGDDGYAAFCAMTALEAVHAAAGAHTRAVVVIEASEESGSTDLAAYVDALGDRLGSPSLVICLDSGCPTYDTLWATTSLRGIVGVLLTVEVLTEGVHSGAAGGIVPSSFRILRSVLSRVEDEDDGRILLPELFVEVPDARIAQIAAAASELGDSTDDDFPWLPGAERVAMPLAEQLLNSTWRPAMATVGIDGAPPPLEAGNVLRPFTRVKLSFRVPPTCDTSVASAAIVRALTDPQPAGARVTAEVIDIADGWDAPAFAPWLEAALDDASQAAFGAPARITGEGGSIPFMGLLGEKFPEAQFAVTGVLGPDSHAHGPNEFVHMPTVKRVTTAVAHLLDSHARR